MENVNYTLNYYNDDKKLAKVIILGFCILLDLIVLAGIITCFSTKKYIDLIIYGVIFAVAMILRIISLFFTFEIIISIQDRKMTIVKKYPIKQISLYNGNAKQLKLKNYNSIKDISDKKYVRLCSKCCENGVYVVELFERNYLIYLDDYLFSLIEVNCDLS
ncbi:MAG: hypothetical protein K2I46_00215 [Clostridia bacterium]|nr:hypothetical protein [Clostridia bacterium]